MKRVVLISTYCDTQEKIGILVENVRKIKRLGLDVMAVGPNNLVLPDEVIKECDFFFYTKENPILSFPVRQYTHWYSMNLGDGRFTTLHRGFGDYGWAALYQTKKLSEIALTYDYDVFHHIIYDLDITQEVENEMVSDKVNIIHPRIDPHNHEFIWNACLHFMTFDRDMMKNIVSEIDLDLYLKINGVAEVHVERWIDKYNLEISDIIVKDLIYYWKDHDFFDYRIHKDFKFFVSKNPEIEIWLGFDEPYSQTLTDNLRVVFYDFVSETPDEIELLINGSTYKVNPEPWKIQEIPVSSQEIETIEVVYQEENIDISDLYQKISFNQIYYNSHFNG